MSTASLVGKLLGCMRSLSATRWAKLWANSFQTREDIGVCMPALTFPVVPSTVALCCPTEDMPLEGRGCDGVGEGSTGGGISGAGLSLLLTTVLDLTV